MLWDLRYELGLIQCLQENISTCVSLKVTYLIIRDEKVNDSMCAWDGRTVGRTNRPSYRDAGTHLKSYRENMSRKEIRNRKKAINE